MSTRVAPLEFRPRLEDRVARARAYRVIVPVGRVLFSLIFLTTLLSHFSSATIAFAAARGVPWPGLLVPVSGLLAIVGGLSVAFGWHTRVGAWLLVLFLVPVTLTMHAFWREADPMMAQVQLVSFMKNLSMLGGALLLAYFGAGPMSIDRRRVIGRA